MIAAAHEFAAANLEAVASVEALHAAIDSLPGDRTIRISVESTGALGDLGAAGATAAAAAQRDLAEAERAAAVAAEAEAVAVAAEGTSLARAAGDGRDLSAAMVETIAATGAATGAEQRLFAVSREGAVTTIGLTAATKDYADSAIQAALTAESLKAAQSDYRAGLAAAAAGQLAAARASVALSRGYKDVENGARLAADAETFLAGGAVRADNAFLKTADSAARSANSWRIWGTGIRLTGNALHWLGGVTVEVLAVTIPAAIAAGAGAWVGYQGVVENAARQMMALSTATEAAGDMGGKTAGQMLGLKGAIQAAQDAANPGAYELLGAAINAAKTQEGQFAQMGLEVVHTLDEFAARVNVDLRGSLGVRLHQIVSTATEDLTMLGQVFGNLGHAVVNFATDMPGIAEALLRIVEAASRLIEWVSEIPQPVLMTVFAFEEFIRWGGLAANMLGRLAGLIAKLPVVTGAAAAAMKGFSAATSGAAAAEAALAAGATEAEAAQARAKASTLNWKGALAFFTKNPYGWAVEAAAVIGVLVYAQMRAQTGAEALASSLQKDVEAASNLQVLSTITGNIGLLSGALDKVSVNWQHFGAVAAHGGAAAAQAATGVGALNAGLGQQRHDMTNVIEGAAAISKEYGVSLVVALGMADAAGVKLTDGILGQSKAAQIARQQIANMVQGYQAMGQTGGLLANDMRAIALEAQLQGTKVQQLNQAWDSFIANLTGGTNALATLRTDISEIGNVLENTTKKFNTFSGNTALSTAQIATALKSFSGTSAQVWQNFDAAVTQANQVMDWFRTAAAAGAVTQHQYMGAIKGVVAELIPYAAKSKTAQEILIGLAQESGANITSFKGLKDWLGNTKDAQEALTRAVADATGKMANLSAAVANFAGTLQQDAVAAIAQGQVKISGITTDANAFTAALQHNSTQSVIVRNDATKLAGELRHLGFNATSAKTLIYDMARAAGVGAREAHRLADKAWEAARAVRSIPTHWHTDITASVTMPKSPLPGWGTKQMAKGGRIPGYGGGDRHLIAAEAGETVVPKELTPEIAPWAKMRGIPGFQSGGLVAGAVNFMPATPLATSILEEMLRVLRQILAAVQSSGFAGGATGGGHPGSPRSGTHLITDNIGPPASWLAAKANLLGDIKHLQWDRRMAEHEEANLRHMLARAVHDHASRKVTRHIWEGVREAQAREIRDERQYARDVYTYRHKYAGEWPEGANFAGHEHEHSHPVNVNVFLDGQKIWENQQTHTLRYNLRATGAPTGLFRPGD